MVTKMKKKTHKHTKKRKNYSTKNGSIENEKVERENVGKKRATQLQKQGQFKGKYISIHTIYLQWKCVVRFIYCWNDTQIYINQTV